YDVVTLRFLAEGGDGLLPEGVHWEPVQGEPRLRCLVTAYLSDPRRADPRDAFDDPAQALEWTTRADLAPNLSTTPVLSPTQNVDGAAVPIYPASQLARQDAVTFGLSTSLRVDALSPEWAFENGFRGGYRTTRTADDVVTENDDLLSLRSTLLYRGLRGRHDRFFVPEPYVDAYTES